MHIVLAKNANTFTYFYIDGAEVGSMATVGDITNASKGWCAIGGHEYGGNYYNAPVLWKGRVSDVLISEVYYDATAV